MIQLYYGSVCEPTLRCYVKKLEEILNIVEINKPFRIIILVHISYIYIYNSILWSIRRYLEII